MTHYLPSSTDDDLLPVVDEKDQLVGEAPRRRVHMEKLRHRAVHVVVEDGHGKVLLQLRSRGKDSFPLWWDISVGGHVDSGEDYLTAARREIGEELGISGELREVARRDAAPDSGWEFVRIYTCQSTGPFAPPPDEIEDTRWVDAAELMANGHSSPEPESWRITPSGLISLRLWAEATGVRGTK
ncbi:MAG: NUDIX domain-containing protein [Candidatus Sumerlaeia bacterium]|nr:NUDIX domain-containing protein [Candidatus Sumerlaeia bacterium]